MRCHVGTLQHLGETTERGDDALEHLKGRGGAVVKAVGKAIRIVRIAGHPWHSSTVHAAAVHASSITAVASTVHDGPACAAGGVDLQPEVVVRASDGMVMLVDDEVGAKGGASVGGVECPESCDGEWTGDGVVEVGA